MTAETSAFSMLDVCDLELIGSKRKKEKKIIVIKLPNSTDNQSLLRSSSQRPEDITGCFEKSATHLKLNPFFKSNPHRKHQLGLWLEVYKTKTQAQELHSCHLIEQKLIISHRNSLLDKAETGSLHR
jgi:hypothetical protein